MNDARAILRQQIFRHYPNLGKICAWLDEHRTMFRRPVWGPVACEVTLKSGNAAAYLEQHVPNATLKSFVVECREDYDLMYREVRRGLNLPINIITVSQGRLENISRMYSEEKFRVLKEQHGVIGYMDESFLAPDPIMQALRSSASVHKVLVGGDKTQRSLDEEGLLDYLSKPENGENKLKSVCIFSSTGNKSYKSTASVSRYSGKLSTRVDEITPARMLAAGSNPAAKDRCEQELQKVRAKLTEIAQSIAETEHTMNSASREIQETKDAATQAKAKLQDRRKLEDRLKNAERKLARFRHEATADNSEQK